MKQFRMMLYYELMKICKRKSTWIVLGIMFAWYIFLECIVVSLGSTYVEGELLETHAEGYVIDRENGIAMSGRKIDQSLLDEVAAANALFEGEDSVEYILTEEYQEKVRPYRGVERVLENMLYNYVDDVGYQISDITEDQLYHVRNVMMEQRYEAYALTDEEIDYWKEKEEQCETPFTYQYADGYGNMVSMSGIYMLCMYLTFFIAICMGNVFFDEHSRKTDQLALCSRFGRKQLYAAKIAAGSIFVFLVTVCMLAVGLISCFANRGAEGFDAAIQLYVSTYSGDLTIGQVLLIMIGLLLLSSILTTVFVMVLSEITHSNIGAMAITTIILFAARLVYIPMEYRVLSQARSYLPINMVKLDDGFFDLRLVPVFGTHLTTYEFAPILYILLILVLFLIGKNVYCRYQIQGR